MYLLFSGKAKRWPPTLQTLPAGRQVLRVMKLTCVLLTAVFLQVAAKGVSQTVTISARDVPLQTVFDAVTRQTGYTVFCNYEVLKTAKKVTVDVKNASVETAMKEIVKPLGLTYSIINKTIVVKQKEKNLGEENLAESEPPVIDIKGRIVNEKGEPVAGASIQVKGGNKGAAANNNGEFELKGIDNNAVLVVSGIGIETFEVKVDGKTDLALTARMKIVIGEEVVVQVNTGYQKISPQNFIGSYTQLDSAAFSRRAGMDIINRLDGTVAGMFFDKKAFGRSPLSTIQIRGISTLKSTGSPSSAPLIIVDQFPYTQDLNTINPNDVESITILKDAAAASIWGAKAGNGVIVITTKKGKYNQPFKMSVSSTITIQDKPDQYYDSQMSVSDFVDAEIFLFNKGAYTGDLTNFTKNPIISPVVELLAKRKANKISAADSAFYIDTYKTLDLRRDLDKYVYRHAVSQQHYINASAGNSIFNYALSVGYNRSLNNTQHSKPDDQFTISSNAGFRPVKNLEINAGINFTNTTIKSNPFSIKFKVAPYTQLADAQGNALAVPGGKRVAYVDTAGGGKLLDWQYRPLDEPRLFDKTELMQYVQLGVGLTYRFTSWLNATANYQYGRQTNDQNQYSSLATYATRDLINRFTNLNQLTPALRNPVPVGGILDRAHQESTTQNIRGQLNFNKSFAGNHQVSAMIAAEISEANGMGNALRLYGYNKATDESQPTIDYTSNFPIFGETGTEAIPNGTRAIASGTRRFVSMLGNVSYSFKNRYVLYTSARKDGSNVFGVNTNKKWQPLWSAGVSWDVAKEKFFQIDWMSSLRLRASYGYTGNPGSGSGFATIQYTLAPALYTNLPSANPRDAPNPDLKWEEVNIVNFATDFNMLHNRLSGSIDVFHKKSTDVISATSLAPSTGILTYIINYANLKGNGFEVNLNSKNLVGAFQWETRFGLSYAKMLIAKLFNNPYNASAYTGYGLHPAEGRIAYGIASYRWAGLDPLTGDPRGYLNKQVSMNYVAILNDSVDNQVFHGSAIPLHAGFVGNSFSWKNFTLSANIIYKLNYYFRKPTISYTNMRDAWKGNADFALRWQKPGDENYTTVPSFIYPSDALRDAFYQGSEVTVLRGDHVRLQDIRLDYRWSNKRNKRIPFSSAQLFLYANNLNVIIWRKDKSNLDPEFAGGDVMIPPPPKSWTAGITLNF